MVAWPRRSETILGWTPLGQHEAGACAAAVVEAEAVQPQPIDQLLSGMAHCSEERRLPSGHAKTGSSGPMLSPRLARHLSCCSLCLFSSRASLVGRGANRRLPRLFLR
jgi:hypothetical protein